MSTYSIDGLKHKRLYSTSGKQLDNSYDTDGHSIFPDNGITIKVMSYNVGAWTAFGEWATEENQETWYSLQNLIFTTEKTDLVGIQEYHNAIGSYSVPAMLSNYFKDMFSFDWTTSAGQAIASKEPMSNARRVIFKNQRGETRSYLIGDIAIDGKTVKLISTHLATNDLDITIKQLHELFFAIQSFDYWIMVGDFNIGFTDRQSQGYENLVLLFKNAGYHVANASSFGFIPTFTTRLPGKKFGWASIDNIICSQNIDIIDVYTNKQKITDHSDYRIDHLPLVADLSFNNNKNPLRVVYETKNGMLLKVSGSVAASVSDPNFANRIKWRNNFTKRSSIMILSGASPYKKESDYSDSVYYPIPVPKWANTVSVLSQTSRKIWLSFVLYDEATGEYSDPITPSSIGWEDTPVIKSISKTENLYMTLNLIDKIDDLKTTDFSIVFDGYQE